MPVNTNLWNRLRYSAYAPVYDLIAPFSWQRRRSISQLSLLAGESVLILGAGTGLDLPFLPDKVNVTAIDITPAMIGRVKERATALDRRIDAQVMDGQCLAFAAGQFDAVILHLILAVIPDPMACIREVERVLKPGGRAVIFDKFVPDGRIPSSGRRILNVIANFMMSDITRQLGPILAATTLTVERQEPAGLGGFFQIALTRKPDPERRHTA